MMSFKRFNTIIDLGIKYGLTEDDAIEYAQEIMTLVSQEDEKNPPEVEMAMSFFNSLFPDLCE